MAKQFISRKLVSRLAASILTLIGLWGSSQVACAQARAYVTNNGDDTISVIDTSSNTVVATVRVGAGPEGVAVTPDGMRLYVANDGGAVWVLDTSNNSVVAKVTVGGDPYGVAITPDGTRVYVTQDNGAAVSAIDTSSNTVIAKIIMPAVPSGVAITPDGRHAYVASGATGTSGAGSVSVIDTSSNTVVATVGLAGLPWGIAITPDGRRAYVANSIPTISGGTATVSVIDTSSNSVVASVRVGAGISWGLAITPDGTRAYAATGVLIGSGANNGVVSVIDTSSNTVIAKVGVADPFGLSVTPDGTRVYVANDFNFSGASSVSVIDTSSNTVVATVGVGGIPEWVAIAKGSGVAAAPVLNSGSVTNGATYVAGGLVPGSWAQVKGSNLSSVSRIWADADFVGLGNNLPTNLSGVQVKVNNLPAAVYYIDSAQVSFQVPTGVSGTASVQVLNNGMASNTVTGAAVNSAPGIFPLILNGTNYAIGVFLDGKLAGDPSLGSGFRNAQPGENVQLFVTGLIPTPSGVRITPQGVSGVSVTVGTITVPATSAGLTAVGEFYINFNVPSLANGTYPITISVNGVSSPATINSNPPGLLVLPIQH